MFDMKEEEYQVLVGEFEDLQQQMKIIDKIEGWENVEPMTFPFQCTTTFLREDVEGETLSRDEVLKNAKDVVDGQIKLPKVVG